MKKLIKIYIMFYQNFFIIKNFLFFILYINKKVGDIKMYEPVIKWTGSKRTQAKEILKYFPNKIDTYYEPFCGGAAVLRQLLDSNIEVNRYICSDISTSLINLWNEIKNNPNSLCDYYEIEREKFIKNNKYYYEVRERFNKQNNCKDFLFLLRTCMNGMPRWNKKGEFNTSVHYNRNGIKPKTFRKICIEWSNILNDNNVLFINQSYENIIPNKNDFVYLDPPYIHTKGMYYGNIDYNNLWEYLRNIKSKYILSFDGISGNNDNTYNVPNDIYTQHQYILSGNSSFRRTIGKSNNSIVYESIYIK